MSNRQSSTSTSGQQAPSAQTHEIFVSIVYALKTQQWVFETRLHRGADILDLLEAADFLNTIDDLKGQSAEALEFAIYAQPARLDQMLEENDRVEIIRPLTADPKVVRRELAKMGKTMGKSKRKPEPKAGSEN